MKKYFFISFIIFGFFSLVSLVFAAGGGGGGGVPTCTEDTWDCTGWSQCSEGGSQTRICSLTFDCYGATTPKPKESQSCIPPTPTPTPPTPQPLTFPSPQEEIKPAPITCTKDTYACGAWSASCDASGREYRTCKLSFDCPNAQTPPPLALQPCQKIQCGNKTALRDRIYCRLNLTPAGLARDLEIQYLPEACRIEIGNEQKECIDRYKSFQPCWNVKEGEERFSCARSVLKFGPVVSDQVKLCQGKKGADQAACKEELKERVLYMIVFRFYDLETRAEALADKGADINTIADFETVIEMKKQEFYKASDNAERLKIIYDVRKAWQDFVNKVKSQII